MKKQNKWLLGILLLACVAFLFLQKEKTFFGNKDHAEQSAKPGRASDQATPQNIRSLTDEKVVIDFIKKNNRLPDCYITKEEARRRGWNAAQGNLCEAVPGHAIGGDFFSNRQKILPRTNRRIWYEADINYACGRRNAERVVFSNDGLVYVTHDHYTTFQKR